MDKNVCMYLRSLKLKNTFLNEKYEECMSSEMIMQGLQNKKINDFKVCLLDLFPRLQMFNFVKCITKGALSPSLFLNALQSIFKLHTK